MARNDNRDVASDSALARIDSKLSALLVLVLDEYLRSKGVKKKERTIDRMLDDAGLPAATVARLLGKTQRAVHLSLQRERRKKGSRKRRRTKAGKSK